MTNPFDQFDSLGGTPVRSENPFDQFEQSDNLFSQFDPPSGERGTHAVLDQPEEQGHGYWSNAARAAGERAADLAGGLLQGAAQAGDWMEEKLPIGGLVWDEGKILPRYASPEEYAKLGVEQNLAHQASEGLKDFSLGYVPRHTWEDVKDKFSDGVLGGEISEVFKYGIETGIQSIPDMAAVVLNLPAYVLARSAEIGTERARNKGMEHATIQETIEAAPFALGSAILERLPIKHAFGGAAEDLGKEAMKSGLRKVAENTAKTAGLEAATEFFQEGVIEYVGERLGTDAQMSFIEALDRGVAGSVAGGVYAGPMGAVAEGYKGLRKSPEDVAHGEPVAPPQDGFSPGETYAYRAGPGSFERVTFLREVEGPSGQVLAEVALNGQVQYVLMEQLSPNMPQLDPAAELESTGDAELDADLQALMGDLDATREHLERQRGYEGGIEFQPTEVPRGESFSLAPLEAGIQDGIDYTPDRPSVDKLAQPVLDAANAYLLEQERAATAQALESETAIPASPNAPDPNAVAELYPPSASTGYEPSPAGKRVPIREGLDPRLSRPEYRDQLKGAAKDLTEGEVLRTCVTSMGEL